MKRILEPIEVKTIRNRPHLMKWRGRVYDVKETLDWWVIEGKWWEHKSVRRVYFRIVTARGEVMEVFRSAGEWVLAGIVD